jgi:hypothetical protein
MPMLASYEEIDSLSPVELRFRQACQFYVLFKEHHGPTVDPLDTRLFWMCHADGFLMTLVSLKDLMHADQKTVLNGSDLFRMLTVLRNVTVHQAVVSKGSPLNMLVRDIYLGGNPWRYENVMLGAVRITEALDHYEQKLRAEGKWDRERRNVEGAGRWNAVLAADDPPRIELWKVFLEALTFVASTCGWTLPAAL